MNQTPSTTVGISQLRRPRRSPFLMALTAFCIVTLDASSAIVLIGTGGTVRPKMLVVEFQCGLSHSSAQRWKIGCHSGMRARRKKYVVNSAAKNIPSVETKRMQAHMPCEK